MNNRVRLILIAAVVLILAVTTAVLRRGHKHTAPVSPAAQAGKTIYQCSMHPQIVSDKPGNCPICGMKLTPVVPEPPAAQTPAEEHALRGRAPFTLSDERQQLIGVRTGRVERRELNLEVRTVGQVAYDPELYNALAEYREERAAQKKLPATAPPETRERFDALVRASALRLRLMGVEEDQIQAMLRENKDPVNLILPGKKVWIYAQIYEAEAERVKRGQQVEVVLPSSKNFIYQGRVAAVDPVLNPATRTLRARVEVTAPLGRLKPESFVHVRIQVPLGLALAVPEEAVLDTGEHQVVFVKIGEGRFEPRAVDLGQEAEGYYEVLGGLAEGEVVVTSANFLIDSESRFRAAVGGFGESAAHAHQP